ncbi:MAG: bifunctional 23S rRNA (guanine(2069)-N(7))-methyltransferase RlmK/23S rRNA (guanine(2445)-N(2))-methyltransferase RlmL [Methylomicrobium sp.]
MTTYSLFAATPKALEAQTADELAAFGASHIKSTVAGVAFEGTLETAYRACLWSRLANRILLVLDRFEVRHQDDLYRGVKKINWFEHIAPTDSIAVTFSAKNSKAINNTHFGALKVKDAIVDQMRAKFDKRPPIDTERPSLRVNVYLNGETAQLSIDLSGSSLHKRGYREASHKAPIKENLAAAILQRAGWPDIAKQRGTLLDPMCGSGTLLIEGALIAADIAPGLLHEHFGFSGWKKHDPQLWQTLLDEAERRKAEGLDRLPMIVGFDRNRHSILAAALHAERAGLAGKIHLERRDIADAQPAAAWPKGLVICNPPYGERLGDEDAAAELYQRFGDTLKTRFPGWQAALIVGNPELGFRLGIRSQKPVTFYNGALECKLLRLTIDESAFFTPKPKNRDERLAQIADNAALTDTTGAEMFANRVKKNLKKLSKWAKQNAIDCYRIYDADLPEFAVAVDLYQGEKTWLVVQEYEAPKSIDEDKADRRLAGVLAELPSLFAIPKEQVFLKIRRKQKSTDQYEKQDEQGEFHIVQEGGCRLRVNFADYLDTGLFLDHRPMRLRLQREARGKRFLNLFAYTGSATVHAAVGGAQSTTTVDLSKTYLDWAEKNLALNGIAGAHEFIRANCLEWLETEAKQRYPRQYDLIFLDPPTFSNSKRMMETFDIQNDHVRLIENAAALLAPGGILYFSTNFRRFKLDTAALSGFTIEDITPETIPEDFARNPKIHYCWRIGQ